MKTCLVFICLLVVGCGNVDSKIGPVGATGPQGAAGTNGTSAKISSALYCTHLETITTKTFLYQYSTLVFNTGDRFVKCSTSYTTQAENSNYYVNGSGGATTGSCDVAYSIPANSTGYWRYQLLSTYPTTTYHDFGDSNDGHTYNFIAGDCVIY